MYIPPNNAFYRQRNARSFNASKSEGSDSTFPPIAVRRPKIPRFGQFVLLIRMTSGLTFKNRASYIQDGRTATLQMLHFLYIFFSNKFKY